MLMGKALNAPKRMLRWSCETQLKTCAGRVRRRMMHVNGAMEPRKGKPTSHVGVRSGSGTKFLFNGGPVAANAAKRMLDALVVLDDALKTHALCVLLRF